MDLEPPPQPQPAFGAPASLLKKEPPGYGYKEEAGPQPPKPQVRRGGVGGGARGGAGPGAGRPGAAPPGLTLAALVPQENGCCSQQMDDLFDILIQSGGKARWGDWSGAGSGPSLVGTGSRGRAGTRWAHTGRSRAQPGLPRGAGRGGKSSKGWRLPPKMRAPGGLRGAGGKLGQ